MYATTTTNNPINTATNTPSTLTEFINNTLWQSSSIPTPPSISTILNSSSVHIWSEIKNDYDNTERCPIDLSIIRDNDIVIKLTHCNHVFKYANIFRWFSSNSSCPVCRNNISNPISSSDMSNNINLDVQDLSNNDISNNSDISNNDDIYNIDSSNNQLENIRRRVERLLNLDSSANIITADITFETYTPYNTTSRHK